MAIAEPLHGKGRLKVQGRIHGVSRVSGQPLLDTVPYFEKNYIFKTGADWSDFGIMG